ncbi:Aste57867_17332 [Aphanomyces stellatus]|uniref:Aste57867_1083 protein n=1 Tax=Aphanomyces stellatus TaxID=120398 RepID=A0A485K7M9_9STRA|nr:hypothetical protein As57867_017273 [Aphanomyces stellatus]KAF0710006.1 hypothetical protein As57867_005660 [Aphanomyces stellatus]KAF0719362.1 hypothetical protein As57867_001082 [Aphanomyces stellatus]VFT78305.1 Aste57867_1083 [Aphanomyces stellatus]VFT82714.1 Aste57867_5673 [Aphanomyces stellatus]
MQPCWILAVAAAATIVVAVDISNMNCRASGNNVSQVESIQTPLSSLIWGKKTSTRQHNLFCIEYQTPRCCLPVQDSQVQAFHVALISTSEACLTEINPAQTALKQVFCSPCDPFSPLYFSNAFNTTFFSAQTFKICRSLVSLVSPNLFMHCGLRYVDRVDFCTPKQAISPAAFFMPCDDGEHVCYDKAATQWYCQDSPCGTNDTSAGFADVPCAGDTCSGAFKFLNDNRGAKPPFFEDSAVEVIDEATARAAGLYCLGMYTDKISLDEL